MCGLHSVCDYTAGTNMVVQLDDPLDDPEKEQSSSSDDGNTSASNEGTGAA